VFFHYLIWIIKTTCSECTQPKFYYSFWIHHLDTNMYITIYKKVSFLSRHSWNPSRVYLTQVMALIIQLPKPNLCGKSWQSSPDNQWEFDKDVSMQLVSRDPERYGEETAEEPIRNSFCIRFCCVSIRNIILAWGDNVFIHGRRLSKKYLSSSNSEPLSPSDLGSFTNSASMSGFFLLWQNSYVGKLGFSSV